MSASIHHWFVLLLEPGPHCHVPLTLQDDTVRLNDDKQQHTENTEVVGTAWLGVSLLIDAHLCIAYLDILCRIAGEHKHRLQMHAKSSFIIHSTLILATFPGHGACMMMNLCTASIIPKQTPCLGQTLLYFAPRLVLLVSTTKASSEYRRVQASHWSETSPKVFTWKRKPFASQFELHASWFFELRHIHPASRGGPPTPQVFLVQSL